MTYTHIMYLSLDWHLKKKMGNALRSMDRGIASADIVMNYLVLMLGSTLIECLAIILVLII